MSLSEPDGTAEISAEQTAREQQLVAEVLASFERTEDARLKYLLQTLTKHLHAFLREVRLSEAEWNAAIKFLTDAGHITSGSRQEFVLLSDVFGASMQVVGMNNPEYRNATEATVFGPFFVEGSPEIALGEDMAFGAAGEPCYVTGSIRGVTGEPVSDALVEVWEADEDGFYDVQYDDGHTAARAHFRTDERGEFRFWGLFPTPYPIPHDGPVGAMLTATDRSPYRASHLHFMVTAPGYRTLVTHIFVRGDAQLEIGDSVFGVKESLIKDFVHHPAGTPTPDGHDVAGRGWAQSRFDIVVAPGQTAGMRVSGS